MIFMLEVVMCFNLFNFCFFLNMLMECRRGMLIIYEGFGVIDINR